MMGILNVTPDSFYDGGQYIDSESMIRKRAAEIVSEGADIIDLGAYSSRPGADDVSEDEEWRRLATALKVIREEVPEAVVSVDTFRAGVAKRSVLEYGVDIINDISGGELDSEMFDTVAELNVPYILMHMQGKPSDMQVSPKYANGVCAEVLSYLSVRMSELRSRGVNDIIVDPGFGFGKTLEDNYELLSRLEEFRLLEAPLLVGVSRKSMIYKLLGGTPAEALNGTSVINALALDKGADILRVHDVREAVEAARIVSYMKGLK